MKNFSNCGFTYSSYKIWVFKNRTSSILSRYCRNIIAFKIFDKIITCCILYFVGGYISSQYLLGSSLSQDVNQFDFNSPADAYKSYTVMTTDDGGIYSEGSQDVRKFNPSVFI